MAPKSRTTYYVRVQTAGSLRAPLYAHRMGAYLQRLLEQNVALWIFYGAQVTHHLLRTGADGRQLARALVRPPHGCVPAASARAKRSALDLLWRPSHAPPTTYGCRRPAACARPCTPTAWVRTC